MNKILLKDYLMGRDVQYPITGDMKIDAIKMVGIINEIQERFGQQLVISSGYRPPEIALQQGLKTAKTSNHAKCKAGDIKDPKGLLRDFILENDLLEELNIFMEDPKYTKGWVHLQIVSPKSGRRVFIP